MFRHIGKSRTLSHNLKIASLLSFVAGSVNVAGFFAVQRLTTNVTGHFAFFIDEVFKLNMWQGVIYCLYILFFFLGSFISGLLIEYLSRKSDRYIYTIPASFEAIILLSVGLIPLFVVNQFPDLVACTLLFAMGLQNSLVTSISNSRVRTTHLTGLFTDLGIELSQLLFYKEKVQQQQLSSSIKLRFTIISFFFAGGILGGILYVKMAMLSLCVIAVILAVGLAFDGVKYNLIQLKRNLRE